MEIVLAGALPDEVALPSVGDRVVVQGRTGCAEVDYGYTRVSGLAGELLFEGGNPYCPPEDWQPKARLGMRPIVGAQACRGGGCTSEPWEVTLAIDGSEEVLSIGEGREVSIEGRTFLAVAQASRRLTDCSAIDFGGIVGSAVLAPIE